MLEIPKLSYWQLILTLAQHKQDFDELPVYREWPRPEDTFLRRRLKQLSQQAKEETNG